MSHTRLLPLCQGFRVRPSGLLSFVRPTGSRTEGRPMWVNDRLRKDFYGWTSGEAARILHAYVGEAMKPQPVNKLPTVAFRAFENIDTSSQGNAIRSSWELSRFPTLAIGKASDQAAVWLFCAVSSQQWFQGLGVSSREASESMQARSSQADCVSFCHGDESWSADQASVALKIYSSFQFKVILTLWCPRGFGDFQKKNA